MISEIQVKNFKSIRDLTLKPGRVTVLIGENGSGKSNILESIAFAAGASSDRLDNTFLFARGIRVTDDVWMRAAFPKLNEHQETDQIYLRVKDDKAQFDCNVQAITNAEDKSFQGWNVFPSIENIKKSDIDEALKNAAFRTEIEEFVKNYIKDRPNSSKEEQDSIKDFYPAISLAFKKHGEIGQIASNMTLSDYVIYAPESTALRTFDKEGAIQPLGIHGEGLLKLIQSFADPKITDPELSGRLADLKDHLHVFGWFDDFITPNDATAPQSKLHIRDKYLAADKAIFDQRSANEGFLFVLFYFALLMSWRTPRFFAIDNIDNALNPKLCAELMRQIVNLATKYGKQVICTTHNPAVLDGLNLNDDEQRLFAVRRDSEGHTILRRVNAPKIENGECPTKLSSAFLSGYIGGLPEHF